jgi:hypothetical protein
MRENRRGNQEWTSKKHWQNWAHKEYNDDKQNTETQHRKSKKRSNTDPTKKTGMNPCTKLYQLTTHTK